MLVQKMGFSLLLTLFGQRRDKTFVLYNQQMMMLSKVEKDNFGFILEIWKSSECDYLCLGLLLKLIACPLSRFD